MSLTGLVTPETAGKIWSLLQHWQTRASSLNACERDGVDRQFLLGGDAGVLQVQMGPDSAWVGWKPSNDPWFSLFVYPNRIGSIVRHRFTLFTTERAQALHDLLQPGQVEVLPLLRIPYGFVAQGRIVAVTYTTADVWRARSACAKSF